ncbi:MAG: hypothetical protein PVI99_09470 [Anaerolineales bacterium]
MTNSSSASASVSGPSDPPKPNDEGSNGDSGEAGPGSSAITGELGGAFDDVLDTIRGLGESVIKFLIFGGGVIFTIGFVYSAMTGTIGQAIGNQTGVSQSVVRGISVLFGFLFLLASFNIATYLSQSITEKAVSQTRQWADFSALMSGGEGVDVGSVPPEEVLQSAAIEGVVIDLADAIVKFMIGLGGIFFIIAIVRGAFDTQLGTLMGGTHMASQGILRAVGAVGAFLFLATAFALSQNLVQLLVPRLVGNISF